MLRLDSVLSHACDLLYEGSADIYIYIYIYSRMLCEGSPLFFYTLWGPVTASGTSHSARRLPRCPVGRPAADRRRRRGRRL